MLSILAVDPQGWRGLQKKGRRLDRLEQYITRAILLQNTHPIPAYLLFRTDTVTKLEGELVVPFNSLIIKYITLVREVGKKRCVRRIQIFVKTKTIGRRQHRTISHIYLSRECFQVNSPQTRNTDTSMLKQIGIQYRKHGLSF